MNKVKLTLRKSHPSFYSIENVFHTLNDYINVEVFELPFESKGFFNRVRNIFALIKFNKLIIHVTGHDHYLFWYPFKNSILTIHDIESLKRKEGWRYWVFKKLWFDIPIANSRMVTTISEFSKKEIKSLNNYKTPIIVIPNPLTIKVEFQPKVEWSDKINILHIGTKENKNLTRLIAALKDINCTLTIIGRLTIKQEAALSQSGFKYYNKVNLSDSELIEEYVKCDVLAFISLYEGFGLPIIEAQAIGRVVITSNRSSMPEVAGVGGAYLINPYSIDEIQKAILYLKENKEVRHKLIEKGRRNVERFKPEAVARMYNNLYNQIEE